MNGLARERAMGDGRGARGGGGGGGRREAGGGVGDGGEDADKRAGKRTHSWGGHLIKGLQQSTTLSWALGTGLNES